MTPTHLRKALKRLGLTQGRAAGILGLSPRTMRRYCQSGAPQWMSYALNGLAQEIRQRSPLSSAQAPEEPGSAGIQPPSVPE